VPKDMRQMAPAGLGGEPARDTPRDALELRLLRIWERVLEGHPVGIRDSFLALGDSIAAVSLMAAIHEEFGRDLPLATLLEAPTIEALAAKLRDGEAESFSSIVPIQPSGDLPPFFGVHGMYGQVLYYYHLSKYMGPAQPFFGLQSRGLDPCVEPHTRIEEMAALYIREIRMVQPGGPYHLGGFSVGGVVAFEIAQQLRARGEEIALLAMFDTYGPSAKKPNPIPFRQRGKVRRHLDMLHRLRLGEKVSYVFRRRQFVTGRVRNAAWAILWEAAFRTFRFAGRPLPQLFRDVVLASRRAHREYVPKPFPGRIILFRATDRDEGFSYDEWLGWRGVAEDGVEVRDVPGSHWTLMNEPHVQVVLLTLLTRGRLGRTDSQWK